MNAWSAGTSIEELTEVGPNNEMRDDAREVVSVIICWLPVRADTGGAGGPENAEGKGTISKVGEGALIAWVPVTAYRVRSLATAGPRGYRKCGSDKK